MQVGWRSQVALLFRLYKEADCKPEFRTLAFLAIHADLAVHHLNQLFGNGQTQAGAAVLARGRGIHLSELVENAVQLVPRNADAGIRQLTGCPSISSARRRG